MTFLLLEDEEGTINLIVPPPVYERDRLVVRTEPLVLADGRLERHASAGGAINVVVERLAALSAPGRVPATVTELGRRPAEPAVAADGEAGGERAADELAPTAPTTSAPSRPR